MGFKKEILDELKKSALKPMEEKDLIEITKKKVTKKVTKKITRKKRTG
jgi:hypothetical protein